MKTCSDCKQSFPEDSFYPKQNQCKACKRRKSDERRECRILSGACPKCGEPASGGILCPQCRDRGYRRQRKSRSISQREQIINAAPKGTRYCSSCESYLPLEHFYASDTRSISRCKKCKKESTAKNHKRRKAARKCLHCGVALKKGDTNTCNDCKKKNLQRYYKNQKKYAATARGRNFQLRMDAFNVYGGPICACCGEAEFKFLSIDHINGEGAEHRRQINKDLGYVDSIYEWLRKEGYPKGPYQVLCYNCNLSKGHYGTCPHEIQSSYRVLSKEEHHQLSHEDLFSLKVEIERLKFKVDQWIRPHRTKEKT